MDKFFKEILLKLNLRINELENESECTLTTIEIGISYILESLAELKATVLEKGFKDTKEEIKFFKYQKPAIVSE